MASQHGDERNKPISRKNSLSGRWNKRWTEKELAARIRRGFGQGEGCFYLPWISTRDTASIGVATRLWSPKTGRTMHFLSLVERDAFLWFEFRQDFWDYQEQKPIERRLSLAAATELGVRHPFYKSDAKTPYVMTVDGVVTLVSTDGKEFTKTAVDCKFDLSKENPASLQRLAITAKACELMNVEHIIITRAELDKQEISNILWARGGFKRTGESFIPGLFDDWPQVMLKELRTHLGGSGDDSISASEFCQEFDARNRLPKGAAIRILKILVWNHWVETEMAGEEIIRRPLSSLRLVAPPQTQRGEPC